MNTLKLTKLEDYTISTNLDHWYAISTPEQRNEGLGWYHEAQLFCRTLSRTHGISSYVVASVLSALSPNNKWDRNKIDCEAVLLAWKQGEPPESVKCCTYNANKIKAFSILEGWRKIETTSPKTHAFAMNVGLNSPDHVTIDKWMIRACIVRAYDGIVPTVETITPKQYRRVEAITVQLAHAWGLTGYQLQAIIWVTIKAHWGR